MFLLILFDVPVYAASSQRFGSNVLRRDTVWHRLSAAAYTQSDRAVLMRHKAFAYEQKRTCKYAARFVPQLKCYTQTNTFQTCARVLSNTHGRDVKWLLKTDGTNVKQNQFLQWLKFYFRCQITAAVLQSFSWLQKTEVFWSRCSFYCNKWF